jgi:hypothetical protein
MAKGSVVPAAAARVLRWQEALMGLHFQDASPLSLGISFDSL